jgi:uncharacterized integral membrane protein
VRPLAIGLVAGLGFWVLLLLLRFSLHNGVSAVTRATDTFLWFFFWTLVLALVAQALAGAIAAFVSRNPRGSSTRWRPASARERSRALGSWAD